MIGDYMSTASMISKEQIDHSVNKNANVDRHDLQLLARLVNGTVRLHHSVSVDNRLSIVLTYADFQVYGYLDAHDDRGSFLLAFIKKLATHGVNYDNYVVKLTPNHARVSIIDDNGDEFACFEPLPPSVGLHELPKLISKMLL